MGIKPDVAPEQVVPGFNSALTSVNRYNRRCGASASSSRPAPGGESLVKNRLVFWGFTVTLILLLIAAACVPSSEDEGPAIEKGPARGVGTVDREKPIESSDMDLAGTDDPELDAIAREVLDTRGAFVPGSERSEDRWMSYRETLSAKVGESPTPFAYWLLAGVNNALSSGSDDALAAASEAVRLAPGSSWAHDMLGFVLSAAGRESEAQKALDKALELSGDTARPPHVLAMSGGRDDDITGGGRDDDITGGGRDDDITGGGRDDDIVRALGESVFEDVRMSHLTPSSALVEKQGGEALELSVLGLPGIEDSETSEIAASILSPQGYFMRSADMQDREWRRIAQKLRDGFKEHPTAFKAWLLAGVLLTDARWGDTAKLGEAVRAAQQAAEMAPDAARAQYMLGIAYYFYKMPVRAINRLNTALELDPDFAAPRFVLADIYARQKDRRRAKAEYRAVMRLGNPGEVEYEAAAQKLALLEKPM
jgi:tetratricopeptide (TPR) repeat protein